MNKKIIFYKEDNKWYADIPQHTKEDNEMVMGADILLDFLAKGGDEVKLYVSDKEPEYPSFYYSLAPLYFKMKEHDDEGATYSIGGYEAANIVMNMKDTFGTLEPSVWLCNVMHSVFGEHPNEIWVLEIETKTPSKIEQSILNMLLEIDGDYDIEASIDYYKKMIRDYLPKILDGNTMWKIYELVQETATVDYAGEETSCKLIGEKALQKLLKIK